MANTNKTHARVDFIPFARQHDGLLKMVDLGGYEVDLTTQQATTAAKIIMGYGKYEKVSVEANGVIVAVVTR